MSSARLLQMGGSARLLSMGGSTRLLAMGGSARLLDRLPGVRAGGRVVLPGVNVQGGASVAADVLEPLFGWNSFQSGVSQLPQTLNLNGVEIAASTFYVGDDSLGATWPSRGAGSTLGLTGAGADPVAGEITAFSDGTKGVGYTTGVTKWNLAPDFTTGNLGDQNDVIVLHYYHAATVPAVTFIAGTRSGLTTVKVGWAFQWFSATSVRVYASDGTTARTLTLTVAEGWNTLCVVVNSATSSTWGLRTYANGVFINSTARPAGSLDTGASAFCLGGDSPDVPGTPAAYNDRVALLAIYKGAFLPDDASATAIMDAIGLEIAQRLDGTWPTYAGGSRLRQANPRTSAAYAMVQDDTDIVAQRVGNNMMRVCRAAGSVDGVGLLGERAETNLILRSTDLADAAWTKVSGSIPGNVLGPDRLQTMQSFSSDAALTEHGVSQDATLTAITRSWSGFARAGAKGWIYLDVSTLANVSAYFDLVNGVVGTVGANVLTARMERWTATLWRVGIVFTGTAASHTHRALTATGDGGVIHAGGVANEMDMGWFQASNVGMFASPIVTEGAAVTKATDTLYYDGVGNFPGDNVPRTLVVGTAMAPLAGNIQRNIAMGQTGTGNPQFGIPNLATVRGYNLDGAGVFQWNLIGTTNVGDDSGHVIRHVGDTDDGRFFVDGALEASALSGNVFGVDRIYVGGGSAALSKANAALTTMRIYDQAVAPGEQGTGSDVP